jgi:hypothetical protein
MLWAALGPSVGSLGPQIQLFFLFNFPGAQGYLSLSRSQ